jgi:hypothetical protein
VFVSWLKFGLDASPEGEIERIFRPFTSRRDISVNREALASFPFPNLRSLVKPPNALTLYVSAVYGSPITTPIPLYLKDRQLAKEAKTHSL